MNSNNETSLGSAPSIHSYNAVQADGTQQGGYSSQTEQQQVSHEQEQMHNERPATSLDADKNQQQKEQMQPSKIETETGKEEGGDYTRTAPLPGKA